MSTPEGRFPNSELGRQVYDKVLGIYERAYAIDSEIEVERRQGAEYIWGDRKDDPDCRIVLHRPLINNIVAKAQFWILPDYKIYMGGHENGILGRHIHVTDEGFIAEDIDPGETDYNETIFRPLGNGDIADLLDMLEQATWAYRTPSS